MAKREYFVLSYYNLSMLTKAVEEEIAKGFEPLGGIAVSGDPAAGEEVFYQAMRPRVIESDPPILNVVDKPGRHVIENPDDGKVRAK